VNPDAHLERQPALGLELARELADCALDAESGVDGAPRAILVGDGGAEERHHAVARVLVDGALEPMNLGRDQLEAAVDDGVDLFGVEVLGKIGESCDVSEEHGDLPALPLEGRAALQDLVGEMPGRVRGVAGSRRGGDGSRSGYRGGTRSNRPGRETRPTLAAEPKPWRHFGGAVWAIQCQACPALAAESHAGRVLELADRASHQHSPGVMPREHVLDVGLDGERLPDARP
jgi:hypothetical protein